ncbi:hypothetical protein GGI24_005023 [Coemansia furcata]|nr:hypothetical protein GGI24_005023 [Coemansia furcata]
MNRGSNQRTPNYISPVNRTPLGTWVHGQQSNDNGSFYQTARVSQRVAAPHHANVANQRNDVTNDDRRRLNVLPPQTPRTRQVPANLTRRYPQLLLNSGYSEPAYATRESSHDKVTMIHRYPPLDQRSGPPMAKVTKVVKFPTYDPKGDEWTPEEFIRALERAGRLNGVNLNVQGHDLLTAQLDVNSAKKFEAAMRQFEFDDWEVVKAWFLHVIPNPFTADAASAKIQALKMRNDESMTQFCTRFKFLLQCANDSGNGGVTMMCFKAALDQPAYGLYCEWAN